MAQEPVSDDCELRVLVVARGRPSARSLRNCLESGGMQVHCWQLSAGEDTHFSLPRDVDVLVIDLNDMTEPECAFLDGIRENSPMVEIVVITSDPTVRDAVDVFRSGVFAVIRYPFSDDQIVDVVLRAGRRKRWGERRICDMEKKGAGTRE